MNDDRSMVDQIPSPDVIRARLAKSIRETDILRQLLRVSERAAKYRSFSAAAEHGGRKDVAKGNPSGTTQSGRVSDG